MLQPRSLRRATPHSRPVVIVADQAFGRTAWFEFLPTLSFHYVIGVTGTVWIQCLGSHSPLLVGQTFKLSPVLYRKTKRYRLKLVLTCALIEGKVSSWLLAIDLPLSARQSVDIYRRRFWCEESFRDQKQGFRLERVLQESTKFLNLLLQTKPAASLCTGYD